MEIKDVLELANFDVDKSTNKMNVELKFDWKTFDIAHKDYFFEKNNPTHPQAKTIDKMIELVYMKVAEECNKSGEYTIDCWKDRYTVRKVDEIEAIHYADMTDDEKAEYDRQKEKERLYSEIGEAQNYLESTDYIMPKMQEIQLTGTSEELEEVKAEYADVLVKRKEARETINSAEKQLEAL